MFFTPGMEKLHGTMNNYIKSMSKRKEAEDREKMLPLDALSHAMIGHGEEFESDSTFGNCLIGMLYCNLLMCCWWSLTLHFRHGSCK